MFADVRKPINCIEFNILGHNEIRKMSAFGSNSEGITNPDMYDNLEPKRDGLIDPRMGTTDDNIVCATCGLNSTHCCGHFGHILLEEPMFNIEYIPLVKKILGCVCLKCSKILKRKDIDLTKIVHNYSGFGRLSVIRQLVKETSTCQNCGTPVAKVKIDQKKSETIIRFIVEMKMDSAKDGDDDPNKKLQRTLTAAECYTILSNISDDDCKILGLDFTKGRPENMILKVLPVPPVAVRPSVRTDGSLRMSEDDLSRTLLDIVKRNVQIAKSKESIGSQLTQNMMNQTQLLQFHIAKYIDSESSLLPKADQKGKVYKSLASRLKGKEGRFRNNLMGKRVDFSARTVITPDPSISVNEVGVPIDIVKNLTFPEVVTPHNIEKLRKLVRNGRDIYPGANKVIKHSPDNDKPIIIDLTFKKDKVELHYGDIVERHLNNSDIVLLNRQPTLHKQSMMGHYVHVIDNPDYCSFRVNVGVTVPYNADFDGYNAVVQKK